MHAREQADFASDQPNLVEGAAVRTAAGVQNIIAEDVFAETLESALGQSALFVHLLFRLFRNKLDDLFLESIDEMIAFLLGMLFGVHRVMEAIAVFFLEILVDGLSDRELRKHQFL